MAALHRINPVRLAWLREAIAAHFGRDANGAAPPLAGLTVLDIGCGGGLLAEPLARLGADVTGPRSGAGPRSRSRAPTPRRPARTRLSRRHGRGARRGGRAIRRRAGDGGGRARRRRARFRRGRRVAGQARRADRSLSTLNRTLKSFALAIVGAEYVLRWVRAGTHRWEQFVTPEELAAALAAAGCRETARRGVVYDLPRRDWRLSSDVSVNYFMAARKL